MCERVRTVIENAHGAEGQEFVLNVEWILIHVSLGVCAFPLLLGYLNHTATPCLRFFSSLVFKEREEGL